MRLYHSPEDSVQSLEGRLRTFPPTLAAFMQERHLEPAFVPDPRLRRGFCLFVIDGDLATE